jgi:predicted DCC family thiol-disulfide oxidoreductase YuxK
VKVISIHKAPSGLPQNDGVTIIYDGCCPFCSNFVALTKIRKQHGHVILRDARLDPMLVDRLLDFGLDINFGMVVMTNGKVYYGADAVHFMAMSSENKGSLSLLNTIIFRHKYLSYFLYPFMRAARNLTLRLLGRDPISVNRP